MLGQHSLAQTRIRLRLRDLGFLPAPAQDRKEAFRNTLLAVTVCLLPGDGLDAARDGLPPARRQCLSRKRTPQARAEEVLSLLDDFLASFLTDARQ